MLLRYNFSGSCPKGGDNREGRMQKYKDINYIL